MLRNILDFRIFSALSVLISFALFSTVLQARQLDEINFPDSVTIDGTESPIILNGMGYRTKFIFNIYVGGLYLESKADSRDAAQALKGPKRVVMHMVYDEVAREKMVSAWNEGFEENNSEEQFAKLKTRLDTLSSYFPDLKVGDVVLLDYVPVEGTRVTVNDDVKGIIEGEDFYTALLDVWLGDEPADDDLKDAMLGVSDD